jgi:hypothetical protein
VVARRDDEPAATPAGRQPPLGLVAFGVGRQEQVGSDRRRIAVTGGRVFEPRPARIPTTIELALRRAAQRRGKTIVDANRCLRRVVSQVRWALPDVWNALAGSRPTALAVLDRWPHLDVLALARVSSITEVVAAHTRGVANVERRAQQIRSAARDWVELWDGHLDLDALAGETAELLADLTAADTRVDRAAEITRRYWEQLSGDDPCCCWCPAWGLEPAQPAGWLLCGQYI